MRCGFWGVGLTRQVNLKDIESVDKKFVAGDEGKYYYKVFFKKHSGDIVTIARNLDEKETHLVIFALQTAINKYRQ